MRHGKVDANQPEIVKALRDAFVSVAITSNLGKGFPDIVAGWRGKTYLLEIKTDDGTLTDAEREFHDTWRGHVRIVRNIDEALKAVGILEE